jgi:hypothetical protein
MTHSKVARIGRRYPRAPASERAGTPAGWLQRSRALIRALMRVVMRVALRRFVRL